jgi:hypothetical protein
LKTRVQSGVVGFSFGHLKRDLDSGKWKRSQPHCYDPVAAVQIRDVDGICEGDNRGRIQWFKCLSKVGFSVYP